MFVLKTVVREDKGLEPMYYRGIKGRRWTIFEELAKPFNTVEEARKCIKYAPFVKLEIVTHRTPAPGVNLVSRYNVLSLLEGIPLVDHN